MAARSRGRPAAPFTEGAAPPTRDALAMLAFMPRFQSEHGQEVQLLVHALATTPVESGRTRRVPRLRIAGQLVEHPELVVADPGARADRARGGLAAGRCSPGSSCSLGSGALRRHDRWRQALDRLLDARDREGRWTRTVAPAAGDPFIWPDIR
jgi:hypothetical protein